MSINIRNISQQFHRRPLRVLYGHTQATPYAGFLSPYLVDGSTPFVKGSGSVPGTAGQGPIMPGMVAANVAEAETFAVSVGGTTFRPFGLFANYIGGDFDEVGEGNEIGVWYGKDAVFEVEAPVFNPAITQGDEATSADRLLYADANGLLSNAPTNGGAAVAYLMQWVSPSKIIVRLEV